MRPTCFALFAGIILTGFVSSVLAEDPQKQQKTAGRAEAGAVTFQQSDGKLLIAINGQTIAEYIFRDEKTLRPYFRHLRTRSGVLVTRNHPPIPGKDPEDHATMHPGLWLAFGELGGADFWRNKGQVKQLRFVQEPQVTKEAGSFSVENAYESEGRTICTETCAITITARPEGYLLDWKSTFQSPQDFAFGDQEEMGLGVRVATALAVDKVGEIRDSEQRKNGAQVWGKQAQWCQYSVVIDQQRLGIVLLPSPKNFRRCWFHARDYGLLVANPFGRNAFTKGEKSLVPVKAGDNFTLHFGVLVYEVPSDKAIDISEIYRTTFAE